MNVKKTSIRDPIHGTIILSNLEMNLIDQSAFQRLRNIKQMGFSDLAFPGATHTRFSHSLGTMHMASRIYDAIFQEISLPKKINERFRQTVRLASLCHDIGHAPLSHSSEVAMPSVNSLNLPNFAMVDDSTQANHEHFTIKILLDSPLTKIIDNLFNNMDITAAHVADLLCDFNCYKSEFTHCGTDYRPILKQIISSELDADRMDYLQRDSFYCGVNYGNFDIDWLIKNMVIAQKEQKIYLAIKAKTIFSFEDFLLSRYHMFSSVYLHHTGVIFEKLLQRFFHEQQHSFVLPKEIEKYLQLDDISFTMMLRNSSSIWARRIIDKRPYFLLQESRDFEASKNSPKLHQMIIDRLKKHKIDYIVTSCKSLLSKYYNKSNVMQIFVLAGNKQIAIDEYSHLYRRYYQPTLLHRIFVDPMHRDKSINILNKLLN